MLSISIGFQSVEVKTQRVGAAELMGTMGKGQKISKAICGVLDSPKKRTKLTILSREDSEFFGGSRTP